MRIGINGRFLIAKRTGVQRAAYNLVRALTTIDQVNEYLIFTGAEELENPDWKSPHIKVIPTTLRGGWSLRNHFWEQLTLPRLAERYRVDILHSPANLAPLFYRGKSIVHIHDLCFVVNPQWYSFSFHTIYNLVMPLLARRATRIVTNSNNSKNDLFQFFNLDNEKVSLIYWAVDQDFLNDMPSEEVATDLSQKGDYILYVGSLEPRKNIKTLIEGYEIFRRKYPELKTKLVLIGGESPLFAEVRLRIRDFEEDIEFKGFVTDEELKTFYRRARIVAYPSYYEGFGLPPLEAMASGTPVLTSNSSSLPEVVGDAALTINPNDKVGIAEAIGDILNNDQLAKDLIRKGLRQARFFNWERVARTMLNVYAELCSKKAETLGSRAMEFDQWKKLSQLKLSGDSARPKKYD